MMAVSPTACQVRVMPVPPGTCDALDVKFWIDGPAGVNDGAMVGEGSGVDVNADVGVGGCGVADGSRVLVGVIDGVDVRIGVFVAIGVKVNVGKGVSVGGPAVGVDVSVGTGVSDGMSVGVRVGINVGRRANSSAESSPLPPLSPQATSSKGIINRARPHRRFAHIRHLDIRWSVQATCSD